LLEKLLTPLLELKNNRQRKKVEKDQLCVCSFDCDKSIVCSKVFSLCLLLCVVMYVWLWLWLYVRESERECLCVYVREIERVCVVVCKCGCVGVCKCGCSGCVCRLGNGGICLRV